MVESFAGDRWSSFRELVADDGEYMVVSVPSHIRCGFGVWGCNLCTVILRKQRNGAPVVVAMENAKDGVNPFEHAAVSLSENDELAIEAIIQSAERAKQKQAEYDELLTVLREEPAAPKPAAAAHHAPVIDILQLEVEYVNSRNG